MIPNVLFFARDYQSRLFPLLTSDKYNSIYVVLNRNEKQIVKDNGGTHIICFEDQFDSLSYEGTLDSYLEYSYGCDRNLVGLTLIERETILKKTIAFWRSILEKYNPQFIINETVAIEFAEVLAIEAQRKGVKYLSWMSFPKENTFYWQYSPFHNSLESSLIDIQPSESQIEEARRFIKGVQDGAERPFYVKNASVRFHFRRILSYCWSISVELFKSFKLPKLKNKVLYGSSVDLNLWNIKLYFLSIIFSNKYDDIREFNDSELIFYPLHYEPEAVLFYMAYFHDNQAAVIENILKCINQNQILVVKEHPQQLGVLLEQRFRNIKKRYPNLIFIKGEEATISILKRCSTVVTLGSTAGFEALSLGKKVIVLGKVFYDSFKGVTICRSFEELYDLFRGNIKFNTSGNFDLFIAKMLKYIKKGNPFPHEQLYDIDNINSIIKAIEDEVIMENR